MHTLQYIYVCNTYVRSYNMGKKDLHVIYVTVRAKTSLVHTSKFATSVLYNFCWKRSTELKFDITLSLLKI